MRMSLYAPVLAKIGAERGKLMSESRIRMLTETKNLQEFTVQLRDTVYQEQISQESLPLTSHKLERAFYENLINSYTKIIKNSPKESQDYLSLYLLRFEVENIKSLIKATNAKLNFEEKLSKIYVSVEDFFKNRATIEQAARAPNVRQLVNSLKNTIYRSALSLGLESYEEDGSTACFDVLADKVFYERLYDSYENLPKKEKAFALFYASTDNDSFTLFTILRGKSLNYDHNWLRLAVPELSFNLLEDEVESMVTAFDFDSALKFALESYYGRFFVKAETPQDTLANAEWAFRRVVLKHAKTSRIDEIFCIGAPLAYLEQKKAEVYNLIVASLGVENEVKPEEIESYLLF